MAGNPSNSDLQFMTARELTDHLAENKRRRFFAMPITVDLKDRNGDRLVAVEVQEGSIGYRRCGVRFNPSQDRKVAVIKGLAAALMEVIADEQLHLDPDDGDGKRCMATALTYLEAAQMFAVKGLFMGPR